MADLTMDEGEDASAAIDLSGLAAPWDDLTGATCVLSAEKDGVPMALVDGTLDAAGTDGKIHAASVAIPVTWVAGAYFCTIEVMRPDWRAPQKQSFDLKINRVAKKPPTP